MLIIFSGAPGVGKTTILNEWAKEKRKEYKVMTISWDDILASYSPREGLTKDLILKLTSMGLEAVKNAYEITRPDIMTLDGVFTYDEEIALVNQLKERMDVLFLSLTCSIEVQKKRNSQRDSYDVLPEARLDVIKQELDARKKIPDLVEVNAEKTIEENVQFINNAILECCNNSYHPANITYSKAWKDGVTLRRNADRLVKCESGNYFYLKNESELEFSHHFNFNPSTLIDVKDALSKYPNKKFVFKYMDINDDFDLKTKDISSLFKNEFKVIDKWDNPMITLAEDESIDSYFDSRPKRLKRTFKKLDSMGLSYDLTDGFRYKNGHLFKLVLEIDRASWKKEAKSDMYSLGREDLNYIPLLKDNRNTSILIVYNKEEKAVAYSFMARTNINSHWYAVKWGATDEGRNLFAGVMALKQHIKELWQSYQDYKLKKDIFEIDLWGRNSVIYDQFSNHSIPRCHISFFKLPTERMK